MSTLLARWTLRRDFPEVSDMDCYADAWVESTYINSLRQRANIGIVLEDGDYILAFMVYELQPKSLNLLRLIVRESEQRKGYGSLLISRLTEKLSQQRRTSIEIKVGDDNLGAQLFFQKNGFLATGCIDDIIEMAYTIPSSGWGD